MPLKRRNPLVSPRNKTMRDRSPYCATVVRVWHRLYYHVSWTTRNRAALIDAAGACFLTRFLRGVARQEHAHILEIGMVSTHVHILVRAHPTTDLSRLMQRLKGGSSAVAHKEHLASLRWAKGYAIDTVGRRALSAVREYLREQPSRHQAERIEGWPGDIPEFDVSGNEEWLGQDRIVMRVRRTTHN